MTSAVNPASSSAHTLPVITERERERESFRTNLSRAHIYIHIQLCAHMYRQAREGEIMAIEGCKPTFGCLLPDAPRYITLRTYTRTKKERKTDFYTGTDRSSRDARLIKTWDGSIMRRVVYIIRNWISSRVREIPATDRQNCRRGLNSLMRQCLWHCLSPRSPFDVGGERVRGWNANF